MSVGSFYCHSTLNVLHAVFDILHACFARFVLQRQTSLPCQPGRSHEGTLCFSGKAEPPPDSCEYCDRCDHCNGALWYHVCAAQGSRQVLRRSARQRTAPDVFKPEWQERQQGTKSSIEEEIRQDGILEGEDYQAVLPAVQQQPADISADQQTLLQTALVTSTS